MLNIINEDLKKIDIDLSKLKNKSILITGASGLLGVYLLSYIKSQQEKYNITIYVWTKNSIDPIFAPLFENCVLITGDITDKSMYKDIPQLDYIIHSSGYGQPAKFLIDKIKTIEINTVSTIWLFEKLKKDGTFLFVSSSEIYDGLDEYDIPEEEIGNTTPDHPRACYIEGKKCGEAICHTYIEQGINAKIVRVSLTYGPGTKKGDTRVVNSLIEKAIKNPTIKLLDSGESIRTYAYVTDVIEMIMNIGLYGKKTTYNVGGTESFTIRELARDIGKIFDKNIEIPLISKEINGSPQIVNICIDRYLEEFNKTNFVVINEGLISTINWQKKLYES
jgi:nucleoside-diphosphate-sugar epimerase